MQGRKEKVIGESIDLIKKIRDDLNILLGKEPNYFCIKQRAYIYTSDHSGILTDLQNIVGEFKASEDSEDQLSLYDLAFDSDDWLSAKNVQLFIDDFRTLQAVNKDMKVLSPDFEAAIKNAIAVLTTIKEKLSNEKSESNNFSYFDMSALSSVVSGLYHYAYSFYQNNPYSFFVSSSTENSLVEEEKINYLQKKR